MSTAFEEEYGMTAFEALARASQDVVAQHEMFPLYDLYGRPRLSRPPIHHVRVRLVPEFIAQIEATGNCPPQILMMPDGREIPIVCEEAPPVPADAPAATWVGASVQAVAMKYGAEKTYLGAMIALPRELWR